MPVTVSPQPSAGHGAVRLTVQGNRILNGPRPQVHIDGYPVAAPYGDTVHPLRPGWHRIEVNTRPPMRPYGPALLDVLVPAGRTVPVHYAAPAVMFTSGSIGHGPQRRTGGAFMAVVWSLVGFVFVVVLALAVALAVAFIVLGAG